MTLKRTPLYEVHVEEGAKLVDFGGFEMPVRYSSDKKEHLAVREGVGLFDVSHMGEVFLEGEGALALVDRLFTNDPTAIKDGQAMYAGLLNKKGGFVDDCVVYRFSKTKFMVCVNASNRDKDFQWMKGVTGDEFAERATCKDLSDDFAQIAVQGKNAAALLATLTDAPVADLAFYHFCEGELKLGGDKVDAILSRTGYTGEDGFEVYLPSKHAAALWHALRRQDVFSVTPCGLSARDTLRLEAGMALYGNDINDDTTPLEAGLSFIVKLKIKATGVERNFIGADALRVQKEAGVQKRLRGVEILERGIPRAGYELQDATGQMIGKITSGTQAPFLKKPIAMAYIDVEHAAFDHEIFVVIREKALRAKVCRLPFYKRDR
ncbi:MAG: glycine cleavage system aminomethyltransferase GcvT [Deltaproteobacteria bacterium]|nr:glycine cleavage system aminomethyltransferase GcvT [Deltaproteobacteria bacterium]